MKAAAVLGLTAAVFALPAAAQTASDTTGFYVGASVGQSKIKDCPAGCDDKDTAWRLLGGYQLNRNFSAELGYHNLGDFGGAKANAWELVGVGLLPVANQFGVYGKLGAHHSEVKDGSSVTGNGLTYGAGLQYDLMPALGLRGEWQRYDKVGGVSDSTIDVLSIGAIWRFR
jgi:OOP family OmpA-OmpF porin